MFSKSEVMVRRIQPDIWLSRITSAFARAIAPTLISPIDHSQIDSPPIAKMSTLLMMLSDTIIIMIEPARSRNAVMWRTKPSLAKVSSRSAWAKSFTDWMLV